MFTLILVGAGAIPVLVAVAIARRFVHWHLVVACMLCGAVLVVATGADRYGEHWKQRLNQKLTTEHTAAREARR